MADGEIRERRVVLKKGIIFLYGNGFWHPRLRDHIGEVVGVYSCGGPVPIIKLGKNPLELLPIPNLVDNQTVRVGYGGR